MTQPPAPVPKPAFSIPSILAVVAAFLSFRFGAIGGVTMAIAAIVLGALGMLLALAPQTRGGIVSLISIVLGLIGILAAVFKLLGGNVL
jgi:hypothetical protein